MIWVKVTIFMIVFSPQYCKLTSFSEIERGFLTCYDAPSKIYFG